MSEKFPYEDIVNLPRPISKNHPQPTMSDRAARFAPFAAITDYEAMVLEEARETEKRIVPDENALSLLNEKLNILQEFPDKIPEIKVTYFVPDKKKSGGAYVTVKGSVKKIDPYKKILIMRDEKKIPIEDISKIESEFFYTLGLDD